MINNELYDLVIKTDKKAAKNVCGCNTCFCELIKENIEKSINLNRAFFNWKMKKRCLYNLLFCVVLFRRFRDYKNTTRSCQ